MLKVLQTLAIALIMSVTLWGNPWMVSPAAAQFGCDTPYVPLLRENGWVIRMNVPDQEEAMDFYGNIMGLTCNPTFFSPDFWAEFYSEDDPDTSIGLSSNPYEPFEPKTVTTQIVPDLAAACINLKQNGVPITDSEYVGFGVCLASFQDFFGNELAYRQEKWNSPQEPEFLCERIIYEECSPGF
ncbi:MAG: VOC family protein [Symploca sp. SIO3E6]|nr:VOC family protein [Caldora sp. SIO3E6]